MMKMFRLPTPQEKAKEDLAYAELGLLRAYKHLEEVQAEASMLEARVQRLRAFLDNEARPI